MAFGLHKNVVLLPTQVVSKWLQLAAPSPILFHSLPSSFILFYFLSFSLILIPKYFLFISFFVFHVFWFGSCYSRQDKDEWFVKCLLRPPLPMFIVVLQSMVINIKLNQLLWLNHASVKYQLISCRNRTFTVNPWIAINKFDRDILIKFKQMN